MVVRKFRLFFPSIFRNQSVGFWLPYPKSTSRVSRGFFFRAFLVSTLYPKGLPVFYQEVLDYISLAIYRRFFWKCLFLDTLEKQSFVSPLRTLSALIDFGQKVSYCLVLALKICYPHMGTTCQGVFRDSPDKQYLLYYALGNDLFISKARLESLG